MSIQKVENVSKVMFKGEEATTEKVDKPVDNSPKTDTVEIKNKVSPPEISTAKLIIKRLTDEQIDQVNKARKLPQNAKFVRDGYGGYYIAANFMDLQIGTRKLPEGFEVRKDALGFTCVLPKDAEGLFIKKKSGTED